MKHCTKCNVDVNTSRKTCPICFTPLNIKETEVSYEPYKKLVRTHKLNLSTKIFLFLSIIAIIVVGVINYLTINKTDYYWSVISIFSIIYAWTLVRNLILSKGNIVSRLTINAFMLSLLLYLIDYFGAKTPTYWSLNYVIPFVIVTTMIVSIFIVLIKKNIFVDSIISLLMLILMGIVQFIFYRYLKVYNTLWTSLMTLSASGIILLGLIIFKGRELKKEVKKRFYF